MRATRLLPVLVLAAAAAASPPPAVARGDDAKPPVETHAVEYRDGDVVLEGWLATPVTADKAPGVLVVHEWWGLGKHAKAKAVALAELGYVAFALDMFGKGKLTDDPKQAGAWAGEFRGEANRQKARTRAAAGLALLAKAKGVDPTRLGAIGFCFGGSIVLELAYSGDDLKGVVCFHGTPVAPAESDTLKAAVLVCHGADDPNVKDEALRGFEAAMKARKADWMLVEYGGAVHSFTNPEANRPGAMYDPRADKRSWEHMRAFLKERLGA